MRKLILTLSIVLVLLSIMTIGAFAKTFNVSAVPTTSPILDGAIGTDEYVWKSVNPTEGSNGLFTAAATTVDGYFYNDAQSALSEIQYFASYDADYIYLAYRGKGLDSASQYFEINPGLTAKACYLVYVKPQTYQVSNSTKSLTLSLTSKLGTTVSLNVPCTIGYEGDVTNDAANVIVTIEVKFDRKALAAGNGNLPFDKVGFRAMMSYGNHEGGFGDRTETRATHAYAWIPYAGNFHEIDLYPEGHTHDVTDTITSYSDKAHGKLCATCGNYYDAVEHTIVNDFESDGCSYPTLTTPGKVQLACSAG